MFLFVIIPNLAEDSAHSDHVSHHAARRCLLVQHQQQQNPGTEDNNVDEDNNVETAASPNNNNSANHVLLVSDVDSCSSSSYSFRIGHASSPRRLGGATVGGAAPMGVGAPMGGTAPVTRGIMSPPMTTHASGE